MAIPTSHGSGVHTEYKFARIKRQITALNVIATMSLFRSREGRASRVFFAGGLGGRGFLALAGLFSVTAFLHQIVRIGQLETDRSNDIRYLSHRAEFPSS
jgi:hypothetical protein